MTLKNALLVAEKPSEYSPNEMIVAIKTILDAEWNARTHTNSKRNIKAVKEITLELHNMGLHDMCSVFPELHAL